MSNSLACSLKLKTCEETGLEWRRHTITGIETVARAFFKTAWMLDEKQYGMLCACGLLGLAETASVAALQQNLLKRGHTPYHCDNKDSIGSILKYVVCPTSSQEVKQKILFKFVNAWHLWPQDLEYNKVIVSMCCDEGLCISKILSCLIWQRKHNYFHTFLE